MFVFIALFAKNCSNCTTYHKFHYDKLKLLISKIKNVEFDYIHLDMMGADPGEKYHKVFRSINKWYPSFYLFRKDIIYNNRSEHLDGHLYHGLITNNHFYQKNERLDVLPATIAKWVSDIVNTEIIDNKSTNQKSMIQKKIISNIDKNVKSNEVDNDDESSSESSSSMEKFNYF